jgi:hypothetical protein
MKKIVMILFAGLLVSAGLQAQKVSVKSGKVILDLTVAAGMPAGAITSVPKNWNGRGTPHNSGSVLTGNLDAGDINERVFQKLEVAPKDMNKAGEIGGPEAAGMLMTWVEAFTGCNGATYDNGGWRLPTQRELQLIWIFNDVLNTKVSPILSNYTALSSAYYWSATERNTMAAWNMNFGTGVMGTNEKTVSTRDHVRCVREVTN